MEELDKYIDNHRLAFDSEEPSNGHSHRFQMRLNGLQAKSNRKLVYYIAVAASFALLFSVSGYFIYNQLPKNRLSEQGLSMASVNTELGEAEHFYSNLIRSKTAIVSQMKFPNDQQKEAILNELKEKDDTYLSLQNDLKEDPNNEMVITALIDYYQVKVNILNELIENLNQVLNNKQGNHGHEETII